MMMPNAQRAVVDIRKLRDYCLNPNHDEGKHKARLFAAKLGMTADDADALREILLAAVRTHDVQLGRQDAYGQRYAIDFVLKGHGRKNVVRSGWMIEHNSDTPRLITFIHYKGKGEDNDD